MTGGSLVWGWVVTPVHDDATQQLVTRIVAGYAQDVNDLLDLLDILGL